MNQIYKKIKSLILKSPVKIIYKNEKLQLLNQSQSFSIFDPYKFEKIKEKLVKEHLIHQKDIITPPRLSDEDILLVHSKKYLYQLKNPIEIGKILNINFVNMWDDYIFDYFRYVSGGTVLGLEMAIKFNIPIFNMGGGYHHAHYDRAEGFCLINDVAIGITKIRKKRKNLKFLIIDLDYHQGNGIMEFFKDDPDIFIISINAINWNSFKSANIMNIEVGSNITFMDYQQIVVNNLNKILTQFTPDCVIYLAGSDVSETDALADMHFNENDILQRDITVYQIIRKRKLPILVLSAGGYGIESWKYYYNFIKWVILERKLALLKD